MPCQVPNNHVVPVCCFAPVRLLSITNYRLFLSLSLSPSLPHIHSCSHTNTYMHLTPSFSRLTCPGIPVIQAKPCQVEESLSQGGDSRGRRRRGNSSKSSRWWGGGGRERTRDRGQVKGIVFRLLGTGGLAWHHTAHPTSTLSGSLAQMGQIITLSPQGPSGGREGREGPILFP